jgi:hypothetical protein
MKKYEVGLYHYDLETHYIHYVEDGMSEGTFNGYAEAREEIQRRVKLAETDGTKEKLLADGYAMLFFTSKLPDEEEQYYSIDLFLPFSYDYEILKKVKDYDDRILII